jgi:hypothetical protein
MASSAREAIQPPAGLALLPGARAAPHASRPSAREAVQPTARKFVELADFGTIRSRSTNEMETYEN